MYQIFTTTNCYRGHSAIVWQSTNFATVQSRVTVGGSSVEYEYKFLCLFAHFIVHRMPYTSILIYLYNITHKKDFEKISYPVHHSLFTKLLGPLSWVSLITGLEYGMEWWNGKWNGTVNVHNYS